MQPEKQAYEVPGQQLRWRVAQLRAQGIPFEVEDLGGGVYVIFVQQAPDANPFAYSAQRRRQPRAMPPQVTVALVVMVVAAAGYIAYAVMGGAAILPRDADPDMRSLFAHTMDAIGGVLLLGVGAVIVWMARPLLDSAAGMLRRAGGMLAQLRRRG